MVSATSIGTSTVTVMPLRRNPTLSRWLLEYAASVAIFVLPVIFFVGRVILKVPLSHLLEPVVAFSALHLASGPFVYWARKHGREGNGDLRPFYAVVGAYTAVFVFLVAHYATRFGLIPPSEAATFTVIMILVAPAGAIVGLYVNKKRFLRH